LVLKTMRDGVERENSEYREMGEVTQEGDERV
jgi:hypothetical protein